MKKRSASMHAISFAPLLDRSPIRSIDSRELFLADISEDTRSQFLLNPIHVANCLYYNTISELHGKLGFPTPSSHYRMELGASLAARCYTTQLCEWLLSFTGGDSQKPFVIAEMGGGEGHLLEGVLTHLELILEAHYEKTYGPESGLYKSAKSHILIASLDQSPQMLQAQKEVAARFGFQTLDTPTMDLGNELSTTQTEWITASGLQKQVNFLYSCEILDDLSGGEVYFCQDKQQWYRYRTVYLFPQARLPKGYPQEGLIEAKTVLSMDDFDLPSPHYILTFPQLLQLFAKLKKENTHVYYTTFTAHDPCQPSSLMRCTDTDMALFEDQNLVYINSFENFRANCDLLCHPNADMVHMDYYQLSHTAKVGFFPEGRYRTLTSCWNKLVDQLLETPLQQPTVRVCLPQACHSLAPWKLQECTPERFKNGFSLYNQLGIVLDFDPETEICMATHTIIARTRSGV